MKCNIVYKKQDNYTTPKEAWQLIFKHIDCRDKVVYLPFYNDGFATTYLNELNINHIHTNTNFFNNNVECDYIIDNPPYSCKKEVINTCLSLNKPFALLLPIETLERGYLHGKEFTIIIPKKRYEFKEGKSTPPFKTCWFCFGFNMNKQIMYE